MPRKAAANAKARAAKAVPVTLTLVPPSGDAPTLADVEAHQTEAHQTNEPPAPETVVPQYSRGVEEAIRAVAAEIDRYARDELPVDMVYLHAEGYRRIVKQYCDAGILDQEEAMLRHLYAQRAILQEEHGKLVVERDERRLNQRIQQQAQQQVNAQTTGPRLITPGQQKIARVVSAKALQAASPILGADGRPSPRQRGHRYAGHE